MTGKERITNILAGKPVDRIGFYETFWLDTRREWESKGHITSEEKLEDHFGFDFVLSGGLNFILDLDFKNEIIREDEDTVTTKDGNGAILRRHKHHDSTPEHIDFTIKCKDDWDKVKHLLTADRRRINFEAYRNAKKFAEESNRYFCLATTNVFEKMHPVCGHENMLMAMILEPEWITEMATQFMDVTLELQEMLFKEEGYPDGMFYYEDMGFKERPFMSPEKYREFLMPQHKRSCDYAHSHNMTVIMHSCGYIEPLLPHMIEAGIDCLQVIEVKAGMDLLKLYREYSDKIAFMGGIDVRTLYTNDRAIIDAELEAKIPALKESYRYILHSDHSIPKTVDYETFQYYVNKALKLGTY